MEKILILAVFAAINLRATQPYTIVGTGQTQCYDNRTEIAPPKPGQPFYGQDAQFQGAQPSYKDNGDGTVSDLKTGLMWVKARGQKMLWEVAVAGAAKCNVGGYSDWRMPTIKELYSLINFNGGCGGTIANSTPYLDTKYFDFVYGDESQGFRIIDSQDWSATEYLGKTMSGNPTVFGVNFADGRIKGYPKGFPGGRIVQMYARYVRGNPAYGKNDFHDNEDGTVTDRATGLTWQKTDSGQGMNWQDSLAWVQKKNAENYLGYSDWRLPHAKELQSIVDYTRSPSKTQSAAISPIFQVTKLSDGDYPFFWTSTSHLEGTPERRGGAAVYVAFGRATGWMQPRSGAGGARGGPGFGGPGAERQGMGGPGFGQQPSGDTGNYQLQDVHGAGAQRSDPKDGDPSMFPHGRGPQGDVIRIFNQVRLVRGGDVLKRTEPISALPRTTTQVNREAGSRPEGLPNERAQRPFPEGGMGPGLGVDARRLPVPPIITALDLNGDSVIDAEEITKASELLKKLDKNGDGKLTSDEYLPPHPMGMGRPGMGGFSGQGGRGEREGPGMRGQGSMPSADGQNQSQRSQRQRPPIE
jgi:hypothetical protein